MGLGKSSGKFTAFFFSFIPVSLFDLEARFFVPTHSFRWPSRAGAVKDGASSAPPKACPLLTRARWHARCGRDDDQRGARCRARSFRAATLYSAGRNDPDHDAVLRIGGEAPRRRTHSAQRRQSRGFSRDPATSNRHRRPVACVRTGPKLSGVAFNVLRSLRWTQNDALRHHAIADEVPERDQQLARQGHDHLFA